MLRSSSSSVSEGDFRSRNKKVASRYNRMLQEQEQQQQQTFTGNTQNSMPDTMNNNSSNFNSTAVVPVPPNFSNNSTASPTAQLANGTDSTDVNVDDPSAMATTTGEVVLNRFFFASAFFSITMLYIFVKIVRKSHLDNEEENGVNTELQQDRRRIHEHHHQQQHPKMKLSAEERLELYNDTFDMNGHQVVLEPHHILVQAPQSKVISPPSHEEEEEEKSNHDLENDNITMKSTSRRHSSFSKIKKDARDSSLRSLSRRKSGMLSSVLSILSSRNDGDDFGDDDDEPSTSLVLDKIRHDDEKITSENNQEPQNQRWAQQQAIKTSGTCSICLERMDVGQTIVYSDHKDCQHVFHKHCLVPAFAYSKGPKNILLRSSRAAIRNPNPCPICRRNFCTTILDHQVALTYGVDIQTTSSSNNATDSQLESQNDGSQQSSSTAGITSSDDVSSDDNGGSTPDDNNFYDVELG